MRYRSLHKAKLIYFLKILMVYLKKKIWPRHLIFYFCHPIFSRFPHTEMIKENDCQIHQVYGACLQLAVSLEIKKVHSRYQRHIVQLVLKFLSMLNSFWLVEKNRRLSGLFPNWRIKESVPKCYGRAETCQTHWQCTQNMASFSEFITHRSIDIKSPFSSFFKPFDYTRSLLCI